MLNLLLLTALTATALAPPAAARYLIPVDNLQAIKICLADYDERFQIIRFSIPFPDSPWAAKKEEHLEVKLRVGNCTTCFDVVFAGATPEPYPKHFYHPYTQDSSGSIHVAEVTISDFPAGTTANDQTGELHFAISSVDHEPLDTPLAFIITWNFNKPKQRLGRIVYQPAPQVIEFAEQEEFAGYPLGPPLTPNRICEQSRDLKLLEHDKKTQYAAFAVTCNGCFHSNNDTLDLLTFSLQPQPQTKPNQFTFVLNGILQSIPYKGKCVTYDGGCRLRVNAPDDFGTMHTIDFLLNGHHKVVQEEYSELGSISASEIFTVGFWMHSIDGKPPSEYISFTGQWDLLHKINKRMPRLYSLMLELTPRISPIATSFQTKQCSSTMFNALLILVAFVAGTVTSGHFRRCL